MLVDPRQNRRLLFANNLVHVRKYWLAVTSLGSTSMRWLKSDRSGWVADRNTDKQGQARDAILKLKRGPVKKTKTNILRV